MNAANPFQQPTHRGANHSSLPRALAWFIAAVGLALAAAFFSPAAGGNQSSAVKPVDLSTSR